MKNVVEKTFEDMYFGNDSLFMEYVEQYFLDTVAKETGAEIEKYLGEYYRYVENLSRDEKENLIIVFKQNR